MGVIILQKFPIKLKLSLQGNEKLSPNFRSVALILQILVVNGLLILILKGGFADAACLKARL